MALVRGIQVLNQHECQAGIAWQIPKQLREGVQPAGGRSDSDDGGSLGIALGARLRFRQRDRGYLVICWNDPVNLMVYVAHVFQIVFGWTRERAERHMMQVHQAGKSLLVRDTFEKAEHYVHQLQGYGLHATLEREE